MGRSVYNQLNRVIYIYELLNRKQFSTKEEMLYKIEGKFEGRAKRTFDRDLAMLRNDFGLIITYKRPDGYYIDEDSEQVTEKIDNLMHLVNSTLFKLKHAKENDFIQSDSRVNAIGNQYLNDFYYAILKSYKVKIEYQKFDYLPNESEIIPVLLKEFNQRWYVYSFKEKEGMLVPRLYSLDRIKSLQVITDMFVKKPSSFNKNVFDNVIGVSLTEYGIEKIVLEFNNIQAPYVKTRPLHSTQKITQENIDGSITIELYVIVNWELEEEIRKHGMHVKVIEPIWVRDKILDELKKTIELY